MTDTYEVDGQSVDFETYRAVLHERQRDQIEGWFALAYLKRSRRAS